MQIRVDRIPWLATSTVQCLDRLINFSASEFRPGDNQGFRQIVQDAATGFAVLGDRFRIILAAQTHDGLQQFGRVVGRNPAGQLVCKRLGVVDTTFGNGQNKRSVEQEDIVGIVLECRPVEAGRRFEILVGIGDLRRKVSSGKAVETHFFGGRPSKCWSCQNYDSQACSKRQSQRHLAGNLHLHQESPIQQVYG